MGGKAIVMHIVGIIDATVELYLSSIIAPFLKLHEQFYSQLNKFLREQIDTHGPLPTWCTANFITYARTALVVPMMIWMSCGHRFLPALTVILVDFGDFLDGVVARYWIERNSAGVSTEATSKKEETEIPDLKKEDDENSSGEDSPMATSSKGSDEDGFQVVSTGSSQIIPSWTITQRNKTYGGFIDAICDKAFLIPCWILLFSMIPPRPGSWLGLFFVLFSYVAILCLILAETASGSVRFKAFYTSGGISPPVVKGMDFSTSAVKADHIGKAKQTFEMVGTSLYFLPYVRTLGLLFLLAAVPLAYESVRRKIKKRVIYVDGTVDKFDHSTLKFWIQAKGLGSKLIVGVSGENSNSSSKRSDLVLNACACPSVDEVIAEAPKVVNLHFLNKYKIDYVLCNTADGRGPHTTVGEDVMDSSKGLVVGGDGVAIPLKSKGSRKD